MFTFLFLSLAREKKTILFKFLSPIMEIKYSRMKWPWLEEKMARGHGIEIEFYESQICFLMATLQLAQCETKRCDNKDNFNGNQCFVSHRDGHSAMGGREWKQICVARLI